MYEVDARGLSCPEPVILTAAAIKAHGNTQIKVLVNEAHTRDNVTKYAKSQGKKVTMTEKGLEYELLID
ncbi:MAG: sulfurtransferase TusA family protein [Clostridium sp.]